MRPANILERTLKYHTPEDGDCIDLVAFPKVFPTINIKFWELCLLGCGAQARTHAVKRLPLRGRLKKPDLGGPCRIVVLSSSLREWLEHYNPDNKKSVDEIMDALTKAHRKHAQYIRRLAIERVMKRKTPNISAGGLKGPGKDPRGEAMNNSG
jgi:hypothetical protein